MKRYTVMLCCNDERGMPTGRLEQISIEGLISLEPTKGAPTLRSGSKPAFVKIGRRRFECSRRMSCVGNVFWDSVGMDAVTALELVKHLLVCGWSVTEYSEDSPFTELARTSP